MKLNTLYIFFFPSMHGNIENIIESISDKIQTTFPVQKDKNYLINL